MILYSDHLLELKYATAQDILYVQWQKNSKCHSIKEVNKALYSIVAIVREPRIEYILLNLAATQTISEKEYNATLAQLMVGLRLTAIWKVACVGTTGNVRVQKVITCTPMPMTSW